MDKGEKDDLTPNAEFSTRKRALSAFFGKEILNHYGAKKVFKSGTVVFKEGEKGDYLFVVESGKFKVYNDIDGREKEVAYLLSGQVIGEMAVMTGKPRSASVKAIEDSTVYVIDRDTLSQIFNDYPQVREILGLESVKREEENIMAMLDDEE